MITPTCCCYEVGGIYNIDDKGLFKFVLHLASLQGTTYRNLEERGSGQYQALS